eukprot:scaffold39294_cov34-Tisochrysis_lutea.AAC.6
MASSTAPSLDSRIWRTARYSSSIEPRLTSAAGLGSRARAARSASTACAGCPAWVRAIARFSCASTDAGSSARQAAYADAASFGRPRALSVRPR